MDKEKFRQSLIHTTRALSGNSGLEVIFGRSQDMDEDRLKLIDFPDNLNISRLDTLRGQADRAAFLIRYDGYKTIENQNFKNNPLARQVVSVLENGRVEKLGIQDFPGTLAHIEACTDEELKLFGPSQGLFQTAHALALKHKEISGLGLNSVQKKFLSAQEKSFSTPLEKWIKTYLDKLDDSSLRVKAYQELVEILDIPEDDTSELPQSGKNAEKSEQNSGNSQHNESAGDTASTTEMGEMEEGALSDDRQMADDAMQLLAEASQGAPQMTGEGFMEEVYKPYTTQFDKTVKASTLIHSAEQSYLRERYAELCKNNRPLIRKLSQRLSRYLLSMGGMKWKLEQEEGVVDAARLAPFVAGGDARIYKMPVSRPSKDTVVTLLLDNSGSMRGKPIEMTAICADVIAGTLEGCGVKCEVLGYTTQAWKGGKSRLQWISDGRPDRPGRLNDLLHLIYKPADMPCGKARRIFPMMLGDELLKENIDGESLRWAYGRLLKRPESRKILVVVSDGAPVDYATDRHNTPGYLDRHLRKIIVEVEASRKVELLAIGIGHDVRRYYSRAVTIDDPQALGETLVEQLEHLFKGG